jgi:hypothetical protein
LLPIGRREERPWPRHQSGGEISAVRRARFRDRFGVVNAGGRIVSMLGVVLNRDGTVWTAYPNEGDGVVYND